MDDKTRLLVTLIIKIEKELFVISLSLILYTCVGMGICMAYGAGIMVPRWMIIMIIALGGLTLLNMLYTLNYYSKLSEQWIKVVA